MKKPVLRSQSQGLSAWAGADLKFDLEPNKNGEKKRVSPLEALTSVAEQRLFWPATGFWSIKNLAPAVLFVNNCKCIRHIENLLNDCKKSQLIMQTSAQL